MALKVDACIAQHIGDRKEQQDRVAFLPHDRFKGVVVAVVADGMGGHTGGTLAAEQVVHTLQSNLRSFVPRADSAEGLLRTSVNEAHEIIRATRYINEKDPHSTSVALLLQPGMASWAHCGDSRFYYFRGKSLLTRSRDHSYVEELLSTGQITPEQAEHHPNKNILITAIGGTDAPRVDFNQTRDLRTGDSFLLCSDGLWAYFTDEELGETITTMSARQACAVLIQRARDRSDGYGDNISVAIVKLG